MVIPATECSPWKGYSGFRFFEAKKEGEFDSVFVTHCNVIIVELKNWNYQPVTACGETWYKGGKNMGRSRVSVIRCKKFTLDNKLKHLSDRFTNKGYVPIVDFFVGMTGNADFSELAEEQLNHAISLTDFLKFANRNKFNDNFRPHSGSQVLNKDFPLFDNLFLRPQIGPKALRVCTVRISIPPDEMLLSAATEKDTPRFCQAFLSTASRAKIPPTPDKETLQKFRNASLTLFSGGRFPSLTDSKHRNDNEKNCLVYQPDASGTVSYYDKNIPWLF